MIKQPPQNQLAFVGGGQLAKYSLQIYHMSQYILQLNDKLKELLPWHILEPTNRVQSMQSVAQTSIEHL